MTGTSRLSGYSFVTPPPGGGIVAYTSNYQNFTLSQFWAEIWSVPDGGGTPTQLTFPDPTDNGNDSDPDVSPDQTRIVFSRYTDTLTDNFLWIMDADGSNDSQLSATPSAVGAMWNFDGTKIVFTDSTSIYSINPDGTGETTLYTVSGSASVRHPVWNATGTLIAFDKDYSSNATFDELWVMEDDGSNPLQLDTTHQQFEFGFSHSWAHASDVIAYTKRFSGFDHVFKINADGTGSTKLTTASIGPSLSRLTWSDDDTLIFTAAFTDEMYQVPASGSGQSAVSPTLNLISNQAQEKAWVFHSRVYAIGDTGDLVSIAFDGSDFRTEATPDTSDPDTDNSFWLGFFND